MCTYVCVCTYAIYFTSPPPPTKTPSPPASQPPLAPNSRRGPRATKGGNPPAPPTDPGSLLLLDDENGAETVEDLSTPPSSSSVGKGLEEDQLLMVLAAGAEMGVLQVRAGGFASFFGCVCVEGGVLGFFVWGGGRGLLCVCVCFFLGGVGDNHQSP